MPLITTIFLTPISTHAACTATPDCATLGYTKTSTDCPDGGVKCPFDTSKMFCTKVKARCNLGDILYSDMSCNATRVSGKTPIGVVSYINGKDCYAISLIEKALSWGHWLSSPFTNVPGMATFKNDFAEEIDAKGKANTAAWVAYYGESTMFIPGYCYSYTTAGTKKGDWYLPALWELYNTIKNRDIVNNGLAIAGGTPLSYGNLTSTQYDAEYVWIITVSNSNKLGVNKQQKSMTPSSRCLISFD